MFKFILICLNLSFLLVNHSESSPIYQFLPERDGYIPVYIRLGDTPLNEINPELAVAFHENSIRARHIKAPVENELIAEDHADNVKENTNNGEIIAIKEDPAVAAVVVEDKNTTPTEKKEIQDNSSEEQPAAKKNTDITASPIDKKQKLAQKLNQNSSEENSSSEESKNQKSKQKRNAEEKSVEASASDSSSSESKMVEDKNSQ